MSGHGLRAFTITGALVLAALALGHELIYLLAHGFGEGYARAMQESGHDRYWTSFVLIVLVVTGCLGVVAAAQWRRLRRLAADVQAGTVRLQGGGLDRFLELLGPLWLRVSAGTIAAYLIQENIETASIGAPLPGLGVLGGEHMIALPVLFAVSLAVAAVGALVGWRREVLLARIRAAARRRFRAVVAVLRPALAVDRPASRREGRRNGVRAPPLGLIQPA
ncbi:MAG: hypothetical protein M0Z49_05805 [Chloroflexi bacterium]|nr:hypothetical protein [Chloroflexota bacterium]MDA8237974.1 hypothetical protein [Chloroflexota bacterium]